MRLAGKLTLALMVGITVVLAMHAYLHVQRVDAMSQRELRSDLTVYGQAVGAAVSDLWEINGESRAREFIERMDARKTHTHIRVLPADAAEAHEPTAQLTESVWDVALSESNHGGQSQLLAHVPVVVRGTRVAMLELSRSMAFREDFLMGVIWTQSLTTAALAVVCGLIALALGWLFVGRPVELLIDQARRVGKSDFTLTSVIRQRDEIGRLARALNTMSDRLARAHRRVREERRARTAALEQLRHADRLSTVGKLASGIAHELGTPLNVVSGRAMMIASGDFTNEECVENANIIVRQSQRMTEIIRQLLDFARQRSVQKRSTRIGDIIEHATTLLEPIADDCHVTIRAEGDMDTVAELDNGKTLQVLTNLMMNGIQAMPSGGTLTLKARYQHFSEPKDRRSSEGDYICVAVCDEGLGIPAEDLEHIFERFFTTKGAEGTGIGLSVCHGIVREHGGWIEVESEPGHGSTFTVCLPQGDTR